MNKKQESICLSFVGILEMNAKKKYGYERFQGNETDLTAEAVKSTFPDADLTDEQAEFIANEYNRLIQEAAKAAKAAKAFAGEVTSDEVKQQGCSLIEGKANRERNSQDGPVK